MLGAAYGTIESVSEWVTGTIGLSVNGVPVEVELSVPAEPVPPGRILPALRLLTNAIVETMVDEAAREGQAVSCRAGCGACCRQLVPISRTEARDMAALVASLPEDEREAVLSRFAAAIETLEANGLAGALRDAKSHGGRTLRELGLAYFQLGIACPFLDEESCSIHPERPLGCREYLVSSPAENCARPTAETVRQIPVPARVSNALIGIGPPPGPEAELFVPLVLALEWAAANPDDGSAATGPEMLQYIVERISGKPLQE